MSGVVEVFMFPVEEAECAGVEQFSFYADALAFLPDYDEWAKSPERFGLRRSASRNSWHELALHDICSGLGISGLEFVLEDHFTCLCETMLRDALQALDTFLDQTASGIPPLGVHENPDIESLREPANADAYRAATAAFEIEYDDSAESFYSFVKSLREAVRYSIDNGKCLLFMRGLG